MSTHPQNNSTNRETGQDELVQEVSQFRTWRGLEEVIHTFGTISTLAILFIMVLTTIDVIFRYILGHPIKGAYEISEILFLGAVFLGLSYTQLHKEHVRVELLVSHIPRGPAFLLESCILLIGLFIYALLFWQGTEAFLESVKSGEYRWGLIPIPLWPARLTIPLGALTLCLKLIEEIVTGLRKFKEMGRKEPAS